MSVLVGSVDARGMPSCCRAMALVSNDELVTATVYVPVATSQVTIANIANTHRIAVVSANPIDHSTIQLKGTVTGTRLARPDEEPVVRERAQAFGRSLEAIGLPGRVTGRVTHWPAFAIDLRVQEIYEQTPGPRAGTRIQ